VAWDVASFAGGVLLTATPLSPLDPCTLHTVEVSGFRDGSDPGNPMVPYTATFRTACPDVTPPEVSGLAVDGYLPGSAGIGHVLSAAPTLNWTYMDSGGAQTEFEVRLGTGPGISDLWSSGTVVGGSSVANYAGPDLADGTDYWFGVRARDGSLWSEWSEVRFHTNTQPTAAVLTSPADGATGVAAGAVTLAWQAATDAEGDGLTYTWELAGDPSFAAPIDSGLGVALSASANVSADATYYWRVRASDGWESGPASAVFTFDTIAPEPLGSVTVTVLSERGAVSGATVLLLNETGVAIAGRTTGANGTAVFTPLFLGAYTIRVNATGFVPTTAAVLLDAAEPDVSVTVSLVASAGFAWWVLLLAVAVLLLLLLLWWRKRRRQDKGEDGPADAAPPAPARAEPGEPVPEGRPSPDRKEEPDEPADST
jgi:hypothetical protein